MALARGEALSFDEIFLASSAMANDSKYLSREELSMITIKNKCREPGGRFAIVDELAPVRFLSREEFESMKKCNPRLIEMKAGDIFYLTEPPSKGQCLPHYPR